MRTDYRRTAHLQPALVVCVTLARHSMCDRVDNLKIDIRFITFTCDRVDNLKINFID